MQTTESHSLLKVLAKDLYADLRTPLAPLMKSEGFRRDKFAPLAWSKGSGNQHFRVWVQCDKSGWFDFIGSRFTLEFDFSSRPDFSYEGFVRGERFFSLLEDSKVREMVRKLNNEVISSFPTPPPDDPIFQLPPELREEFLSCYKLQPSPYQEGEDIWLHYYTRQHTAAWAAFLAAQMPKMLAVFAKKYSDFSA